MRSRHGWLLAAVFLLALLGLAPAALAGRTGGSMGGGSWGGSHSSSSGGGYHSSGGGGGYSYSGGGGYQYYGGGGGGGCNDPGSAIFFVIAIGLVFGISAVVKMIQGNRQTYDDIASFSPAGDVFDNNRSVMSNYADVTVLRIALDGRARKFVQTELSRIAKAADTSTPSGRADMLREVALMLRRLKDAWVYGGAVNEQMREMGAQKAVFDKYCDDARARFMDEIVRNEQGVTSAREAPEASRELREAEGLILVSVIVAAHSELYEVEQIGDGEGLRSALESVSHRTADDLIAIEIIWEPADTNDLISSIELEAKYPAPDLIKIKGALVGKVFCAYCGGPFPAELVSCPHCGAPAAGATPAA